MSEIEEIIEEYVGILRDKSTEQMKIEAKQAIEAYISKHYIKKEDVLEAIETNQKGQFEDDAGHICWYLDDLVSAIKKLNIGDK